jgi:hypothetical protein
LAVGSAAEGGEDVAGVLTDVAAFVRSEGDLEEVPADGEVSADGDLLDVGADSEGCDLSIMARNWAANSSRRIGGRPGVKKATSWVMRLSCAVTSPAAEASAQRSMRARICWASWSSVG